MLTCAREGCNEKFWPKSHNQKFHDSECCRLATNDRIKEQYHDRRAQRLGEARYCPCGTKLSRYNTSKVCSSCEAKKRDEIASGLDSVVFAIV